jgi:predicted outer membrane repeat protein
MIWYVDDDAPNDPGPGDPLISDPLEDGSTDHPFDAIQEGADAAIEGDTVLVLDGTYTGSGNRDVDLSGRLITVRSENGPAACIIDCEQATRAFRFVSADSTGAVVEGFTITNGHAVGWGGAMLINSAGSPTVTDCMFTGNTSENEGGALLSIAGEPAFIGCSFVDNSAETKGGAVYSIGSPSMSDCLFSGNSVSGIDPLYGGGALYVDGSAATITSCNFEGNAARHGGAIFLRTSHAALTDCDFSENIASYRGGAIYNLWLHSSPPELEGCSFTDNSASEDGGAIFNGDDAMMTVNNCDFTANSAGSGGGALCNLACASIAVTGSDFSTNTGFYGGAVFDDSDGLMLESCHLDANAGHQGGAIFSSSPGPMMTNDAFCGNSAEYGGGIMIDSGSPETINCTFCGNEATQGGGLYNLLGAPVVANCVFWSDAGGEIVDISETAAVSYSDVQGAWPGPGNIDADPLFVDSANGDHHLSAGSPCIDAADCTAMPADLFDLDGDGDTDEPIPFDLDGNPRFVDDPETEDSGVGSPCVDMGAYEYQILCPADLTGDGTVNVFDLLQVLFAWGDCPDCPEDLNDDDVVNVFDLLMLLGAWGECD